MKLPPQAQKVFSGIRFDTYQWPQELFDGTSTTFEMVKRKPGAHTIAVTPDKKILLLEDEHPNGEIFFTLPAGIVENEEHPLEAAKRELLEETGYTSDKWTEYAYYNSPRMIDGAIHIYIAKDCTYIQAPSLDGGERNNILLLSFDEFVTIITEKKGFRTVEFALELCRMRFAGTLNEFQEKIFN